MPHLLCAFCHKNQLLPGKSVSNNAELLQLSPNLSIHKLCLNSAAGLLKRSNYEYSSQEILSELKRSQSLACDYCQKLGASTKCAHLKCHKDFHLACFYQKLARNDRKPGEMSYCSKHMLVGSKANYSSPRRRSAPVSSSQPNTSTSSKRQLAKSISLPGLNGQLCRTPPKVGTPTKRGSPNLTTVRSSPRVSPKPSLVMGDKSKASSPQSSPKEVVVNGPERNEPMRLRRPTRQRTQEAKVNGVSPSSSDVATPTALSAPQVTRTQRMNGDYKPMRLNLSPKQGAPALRVKGSSPIKPPALPSKNVQQPASPRVCSIPVCLVASLTRPGRHPFKQCQVCKSVSAHAACVDKSSSAKWTCAGCTKAKPVVRSRSDGPVVSNNGAIYSTMKMSFCKEIDTHLDKLKQTTRKRSDRSPLSLKQKDDQVTGSGAETRQIRGSNGKENNIKLKLAKKRDTWIVKKDLNKASADGGKDAKAASHSVESSPAKKFVENDLSHNKVQGKNLSKAFNNVVEGKKTKKINKKGAKATKVKKINVEPKSLDQRQLYHIRNNLPIEVQVPELEEDYEWLVKGSDIQIDDFLDLNNGEKAFFKLWNRHLHRHPCYGDKMMIPILQQFVHDFGQAIHRQNLYRNFILHLSNLFEFSVISQQTMFSMTQLMQKEMLRAAACCEEKPDTAFDSDKPPLTSEISTTPASSSRESSPEDDASSRHSLKLYLSDETDEDKASSEGSRKAIKSTDIVFYACDQQVDSISDSPRIKDGLCPRGTRFQAFASPIIYKRSTEGLRRKRKLVLSESCQDVRPPKVMRRSSMFHR